ncbi:MULTISPECIES: hypothetical protein [Lysobacter]|jgi:hypothetical protein|uniref:hypothetical protein n=1 Tax=Lysobacter TaxID=68 RepID=UPI001F3EB033|nr:MULTISPECIES: hypothetical protein [Lysobacter]UJB19158.1 hypothetical protein L1A79_23075 [Lysobacter capsici]UJQ27117.1 hypothetical protein L2D09_16810 [Lysobacter gummosus]
MQIADDETINQLLGKIVAALSEGYSKTEAESLVRDYYSKFTAPAYCKSIGVPVQDDDFFFHEGIAGMALRIHYYIGLEGDPAPEKFIEWRTTHLGRD